MSHIVIVGAGRVGLAVARLLQIAGYTDVLLLDTCEEAVVRAHLQDFDAVLVSEPDITPYAPKLVICSTPYHINVQVAQQAAALGCSYIDFTEDVSVTKAISQLSIGEATFVPQTGLAPGLISYIGLDLFKELGTPKKLSLRVGALPQVSFGPEHYALTWSPEGLINEYVNPVERKLDGKMHIVAPLTDLETVVAHGVTYEAFTTSGGVGSIEAYQHIPTVDYKTIRYPGHCQYISSLLFFNPPEQRVALVKKLFVTTRSDTVVLVAHAVDDNNASASVGLQFFPARGLTALELTTAGTGVAVAELVLARCLPRGVLKQNDIPLSILKDTTAGRLVFEAHK